MTRRIFFTVAAALVLIALTSPARAQSPSDFKIPFDFVANGKTYTAGQYALTPNLEGELLTLQPMGTKGASAILPVESRLGERKPLSEPQLIFDNVNGKYYLSELHTPGEDGYLLLATKGKHTHQLVTGSKKKS